MIYCTIFPFKNTYYLIFVIECTNNVLLLAHFISASFALWVRGGRAWKMGGYSVQDITTTLYSARSRRPSNAFSSVSSCYSPQQQPLSRQSRHISPMTLFSHPNYLRHRLSEQLSMTAILVIHIASTDKMSF